MSEDLKYRIAFTKGSLEGQLFPLGKEPVTVGRSHTCGIRVMEPDVSGRHVRLSVGAKGVELEVISSRRTVLDGKSLRTGDRPMVKAGQTVSLGGSVAFAVECYRSDGERTEVLSDWTNGTTRTRIAPGPGMDDETTRNPIPVPDETSLTAPAGHGPGDTASPSDTAYDRTAGASRSSSGDTVGTGLVPVTTADATQSIQTRVATPQEMAYMRDLHNRKRQRKLWLKLGLGGLAAAIAAGVCIWLAMTPPEPILSDPPEWAYLDLVDGEMNPVEESADESIYLSYPVTGGWGDVVDRGRGAFNEALGTMEHVFSVKTRIGRDLDVPLQLTFIAYTRGETLNQSQEESFGDWDRNNSFGIEKQTKLLNDFIGANHGIPCLRYTYTRKASPEERTAAEGEEDEDWSGVLSFFRLRDSCFLFFREVPSVEQLRAEHLLLPSDVFLGVANSLVQARWTGMDPSRQYRGDVDVLRRSAVELLDKNMDNEWEELEDKLTTILIRTYPDRENGSAEKYDDALKWMAILRDRQTETWKRRCVARLCVQPREEETVGKQQDEAIRALFRSPDDRRRYIAQREDWWLQ